MAAAIPFILQGLVALLNAAPQIEQGVASAKQLIDALFSSKIFSVEIQKALHDYVDAHAALMYQGITIPSSAWSVEADPK